MDIIRDGYPKDYKGYLINPSFLNALDIIECLDDPEFTEIEKQGHALKMLFGLGYPEDINLALDGLSWFLNCGIKPTESNVSETPCYDFKKDGGRIASAFKRFYNTDITKENLHWFDFCDKMSDFGECAFTNVIDIRKKDLNDKSITSEMKSMYLKLKERYSLEEFEDLEETMTDDENEKIRAFLEMVKN